MATLKPSFIRSPIGGINKVASLVGLPTTDVLDMQNFTCTSSSVIARPGTFYQTTTNFSAVPKSLHTYAAVGGTTKLFATTSAGVYDITSVAAVPAASVALTNGFTIGAVLSTGAQNYLTLVNGTDNMQQYDGAAWTGTATVGGGAINTNTFSYVEVYRQRLYFIVKNTTRLVYLNANSVTGGGTNYDTAAIFKRGGYLVAMGTWTIDGGTGPDDHLVLVTSQGELAVFAGNDPASWTYKGTYYIAPPMGKRPFIKYGGDLLFLSTQGLYPLSKALLVATLDRSVAVSGKINPTFINFGAGFSTDETWSMAFDFSIPALLITSPGGGVIYGMNTQTRSWFRWLSTAWTATCIANIGNSIYIGSNAGTDKRVVGFAYGTDDLGTDISCQVQWGYLPISPKYTVKVEKFQPVWVMPGNTTTAITGSFQLGVASGLQPFSNTNSAFSSNLTGPWYSVPDAYSWLKTPVFTLTFASDTSNWVFSGINLLYKQGSIHQNVGTAWTV